MSKIESFLKLIHLPEEDIKKLTGDTDLPQEEITKLTENYIKSRQDYFESSVLPDKLKSETQKVVEGMTLKAIKQINKTFNLGLTNSQMEEFKDLESFMPKASEIQKTIIDGLTTGEKQDLVNQINDYKLKLTDKQTELEGLKTSMDAEIQTAKKNAEKEVKTFKAKEYFQNLVKSDDSLPELPGKDFVLKSIMEKIFSTYDVSEDGTILNHDGTIPMHPDTSRAVAVKKIDDVYAYYKGIAGLVKQNNAGEGAAAGTAGKLNPDGTPKPAGSSEKFLLSQLS